MGLFVPSLPYAGGGGEVEALYFWVVILVVVNEDFGEVEWLRAFIPLFCEGLGRIRAAFDVLGVWIIEVPGSRGC